MARHGVKGKVIFISSTLGLVGFVGYTEYVPSKYALRGIIEFTLILLGRYQKDLMFVFFSGLADCLRNELILYDIGVHCYFPGGIRTAGFEIEVCRCSQKSLTYDSLDFNH
jgi:3-dehydrosphinganine reductase